MPEPIHGIDAPAIDDYKWALTAIRPKLTEPQVAMLHLIPHIDKYGMPPYIICGVFN